MTRHRGSPAAGGRAVVRDREESLVTRLPALGAALDGEPDPAFREATRARLVAMAAVRTPEPARPAGLRRWWAPSGSPESAAARRQGRLTAGLAGAAVAVTAFAGLVAVSTEAQPGDPLYGLKRGAEQTQLALAADSTRGQTLLDFASTRLQELDRLLSEGTTALPAAPAGADGETVLAAGSSPELVSQTLRTMDAQTTEGAAWLATRAAETSGAAPLDDLLGWVAGQSDGLSALAPKVPEGASDAMASSLTLLTAVRTRGTALRDALACASGPAIAGSDVLGPIPLACGQESPSSARGGGTTTAPAPAPAPEEPSSDQPVPATPTAASGGAGGSAPGSDGTGGGTGSPTVPEATVPGLPTPSLPTPSLPLPSLPRPSLPLPLPGGGSSTPPAGPASNSPPAIIDTPLPICLPPILC